MAPVFHDRWMTPLVRRLGLTNPIFGFCHGREVVAEISLCGGLGVLGATRNTPEEIEEHLKWIRTQIGQRPFGVNLVLPGGMPETDDRAQIEAQLPAAHRAFVQGLYEQFQVPAPTRAGVRSRFVRSNEMAARQM